MPQKNQILYIVCLVPMGIGEENLNQSEQTIHISRSQIHLYFLIDNSRNDVHTKTEVEERRLQLSTDPHHKR